MKTPEEVAKIVAEAIAITEHRKAIWVEGLTEIIRADRLALLDFIDTIAECQPPTGDAYHDAIEQLRVELKGERNGKNLMRPLI